MRILQLITLCELGGAQSVVANLANELVERGHDVIVAAGEGDGKMFDLLDKRIITDRIPSLVRRLSPIDEIKAIIAMRKLYRKYRPDVIQLHSSKAGLLGRIAFPKDKTVYTVHGFDSIRIAYRKFLPLERALQKRCAAIVGVSRYDYENLHKEGITHNVSYVYNGIFKPSKLDKSPFEKWQSYENKILCIARFAPPKRPDLYAEVARLMPDCAFIWIGNQQEPEGDYPSNMFFMGNITGAGSYTGYADVFALPSNYEGLPMVIIEALSMGTPVVASAVGGISELLDGSNGFAVENEASAMAEKIRCIISDKARKKEMSRNAADTFNRSFTVKNMTDGYMKIYERIFKTTKR